MFGLVLIVFGALIPTIFASNNDELIYERKFDLNSYSYEITIASKKDYTINDITVNLQDVFNDYNKLTKTLEASEVTKTKDGNKYVYSFVLDLTQTEFFDYTEISSVNLSTNIGERTAEESSRTNWKTPVMVIIIISGFMFVIVGISLIASAKMQKKLAEKARKDLAKTNPEIYTANMTDEEVLAKQRELEREEFEENGGVASLFGIETKPKEKICEYCRAINGADAKKCSSCGANLRAKK